MHWIDGDRCKQISAALGEARDALDRAWYQCDDEVDLFMATQRASRALGKARREIRRNQPGLA